MKGESEEAARKVLSVIGLKVVEQVAMSGREGGVELARLWGGSHCVWLGWG